ncbi:hypothetical protein HMPREF9444_01097 [Succinatimonas hippei YIT 12066]|uniref:Uncharacterized protein n=1 Tax=Succinatimonas hippei (strain DSM 22608 / JCM 16073 / KCTC 15190 / YIT 12066) TaxID=762983 RepID=E8LK61_SUCHY|nr:hypothetical protein HMPREF9444_01097 [Succinatimonas hippei YIT 12066]
MTLLLFLFKKICAILTKLRQKRSNLPPEKHRYTDFLQKIEQSVLFLKV